MSEQDIQLPFPVGGLNEDWARAEQPPLTSPELRNIWPDDRDGRVCGAQRWGVAKIAIAAIGGGTAVGDGAYEDPGPGDYPGDSDPYDPDIPYDPLDPPGEVTPEDPGDDPIAGPTSNAYCGDTVLWYRARSCADGTFQDIYMRACDLPPFVNRMPFKLNATGVCYEMIATDTPTAVTPGTSNQFAWTAITLTDGCFSEDCDCDSPCPTVAYAFGSPAAHYVEKGYAGAASTCKFVYYGTTIFSVCTTGLASIGFNYNSDDLLVLMQADAAAVTETYSGVGGDPVTLALPPAALLFRNTDGWMIDVDSPSQGVGRTCQKTITQGADSYTFPAGRVRVDGLGQIVDMEAGGFTTYSSGEAITIAALDALGFIDDDGRMRFRFVFIPGRSGYATVNSLTCTAAPPVPAPTECTDADEFPSTYRVGYTEAVWKNGSLFSTTARAVTITQHVDGELYYCDWRGTNPSGLGQISDFGVLLDTGNGRWQFDMGQASPTGGRKSTGLTPVGSYTDASSTFSIDADAYVVYATGITVMVP